jgi:hypothetical protein
MPNHIKIALRLLNHRHVVKNKNGWCWIPLQWLESCVGWISFLCICCKQKMYCNFRGHAIESVKQADQEDDAGKWKP